MNYHYMGPETNGAGSQKEGDADSTWRSKLHVGSEILQIWMVEGERWCLQSGEQVSPEMLDGSGDADKEVGSQVLRNKLGFDLEALGCTHHTSPEALK